MRRFIAFFGLLLVVGTLPAAAQTTTPVPPTPGLGLYWLVDDNAWDGVWIRDGESNHFDARWSLDDEEDISASLTITVKGTQVSIKRVDPPNIWTVESCLYTGEFQPDGVTIYGTVDCIHTDGATQHLSWSATVIYESPLEITWDTRASRYRAAKGIEFDFICPQSNALSSLWGTNLYTDDSSICTAAVHTGMLTQAGGVVTVEITDGQSAYTSSTNNGVTSNSYGAWRASYQFANAATIIPEIDWSAYVMQLRGKNGEQYPFHCLPQAGTRPVWGTDIYTDDSSVCAAAMHAGLISTAGGIVTIEIMPGQAEYQGTERNGVSTHNYGAWGGSFRFVS